MKYLITGITGFVGPHLAKLLQEEGHQVAGLVRCANGRERSIADILGEDGLAAVEFHYGDITDAGVMDRLFKDHEFDGVFHLAAQSHPPTSFLDPAGTFEINTQGTRNIAFAIKDFRPTCRLMFCSTSEVYGVVAEDKGLITEDFPLEPVNPYGRSKMIPDQFVRELAGNHNLDFFVTRAFSHTGPRRGHKFSIASDAVQIARICKGQQESVIRVGTLSSRRAVCDVRDVCVAYWLLMQKAKRGEAYNVGGSNIYSMGELLDKQIDIGVASLTGGMVHLSGVRTWVDPALVRPVDIPLQQCDTTKLRELTGWEPKIPIEQTLEDLLKYWYGKL